MFDIADLRWLLRDINDDVEIEARTDRLNLFEDAEYFGYLDLLSRKLVEAETTPIGEIRDPAPKVKQKTPLQKKTQNTFKMRHDAHKVFDQLWQEGHMTRPQAYVTLSVELGKAGNMPMRHFKDMDLETCQRAIQVCKKLLSELGPRKIDYLAMPTSHIIQSKVFGLVKYVAVKCPSGTWSAYYNVRSDGNGGGELVVDCNFKDIAGFGSRLPRNPATRIFGTFPKLRYSSGGIKCI